jgi:ferrous iron transport protein A
LKCPVSSMRNGQWGTLTDINGGEDLTEKLASLGIRIGTRVGKKYGLLGQGPVVLTVGTGEVAIGYGMASRMMVQIEGGEGCSPGHAHKRHTHGRRLFFWERGHRRQKRKS